MLAHLNTFASFWKLLTLKKANFVVRKQKKIGALRKISFNVLLVLLNPQKTQGFSAKKLKDFRPINSIKISKKNSSSNLKKTQKPPTPVKLNCRKSAQKISLHKHLPNAKLYVFIKRLHNWLLYLPVTPWRDSHQLLKQL